MNNRIYRVDTGFAVGGIITEKGKVIECAPILKKWFLGKDLGTVMFIVNSREWFIEEVIVK